MARTALQAPTAIERHRLWEQAIQSWRQGLTHDAFHFPCWFNQLHGQLVLGDRSSATQSAYQLLHQMLLNPSPFLLALKEDEADLIWVETAAIHPIKHPDQVELTYWQCHLVYWLATQSRAIYSETGLQLWQFALALNPNDRHLQLLVGLVLASYGRIQGIYYLRAVVQQHPEWQPAQVGLAVALLDWQPAPLLREPLRMAYEGYQLVLEPTLKSVTTLVLLAQGAWFEDEIQFFRHQLQPGMRVIDVGANVGVYTFLSAAQVGPKGRVYAIDPTPECIQCLQDTTKINQLESCVIPIAAAAGQEVGQTQLVYGEAHVFNHIARATEVPPNSHRTLTVDLITLDQLWLSENQPTIHLIKIDAEGAELEVLQGATTLIQACHPVILFENNDGQGPSGASPAQFLSTLGYSFYLYNPHLKVLDPVDPLTKPVHSLNIIAKVETEWASFQ